MRIGVALNNLIEWEQERQKCLTDPVYFIETYVRVNGCNVKLKDSQKAILLQYCNRTAKPKKKEPRRGFDISRLK